MQQDPNGNVGTDSLDAHAGDGDGPVGSRDASPGRHRRTNLFDRWSVRYGVLAAGLLVIGGASLLVAYANTPETMSSAAATGGYTATASGDGSGSPGAPAVVRETTAKGTSATATPTTSSGSAGPSKKATPTAGAQSSTPSTEASARASSQAPSAAASSAASTLDPSGENPLTSLSGFSLTYVQDFTGNSIPANWDAYNGTPGGETANVAQWVPSMCTFSGGEAHFMADGIDSCGLQYYGSPQEYGAWFARLKTDIEPSGELISNIFLLWPDSNDWPPEIDIYEDHGGRASTTASVYDTVGSICGSSPTASCLAPYAQGNSSTGGVSNDDTQWHTYGVEWTPTAITWLIDGNVVYTAPASAAKSPAQQPAQTMGMDLQSQNLQGTTGAASEEETMTVDWVEQFSYNG